VTTINLHNGACQLYWYACIIIKQVLLNWLHHSFVIYNTQSCQWSPTLTNSDFRNRDAYLDTVIHLKITVQNDLLKEYTVFTNDLFDYLYQLRRFGCLNVTREVHWYHHSYNFGWLFIRLKQVSVLCQPISIFLRSLQNPANHWCCKVCLTYKAMPDSWLCLSWVLVEIAHAVIMSSGTSIQ